MMTHTKAAIIVLGALLSVSAEAAVSYGSSAAQSNLVNAAMADALVAAKSQRYCLVYSKTVTAKRYAAAAHARAPAGSSTKAWAYRAKVSAGSAATAAAAVCNSKAQVWASPFMNHVANTIRRASQSLLQATLRR